MRRPSAALFLALFLTLAQLALLGACARTPQDPPAAAPPEVQTSVRSDGVATDEAFLARCRAAAEYSRKHDGEGMLVLIDGKPAFEDFRDGESAALPHLLASGTKSYCGIAAAFAIEDGFLSLDEAVADTIVEWRDDPAKSRVTVRQLLSLSSGLAPLSSTIDSARNAAAAGIRDRAKASIDAPLRATPGERFIYGPSQFYVFGELMKRKLASRPEGDADLVGYLERRLFTPLGISPRFLRDAAGNANLPGGSRTSAHDWAVFGEFVRNGGRHAGEPLLDPAILAEVLRPQGPNPRYGLTWWLLRDGAGTPEDEVAIDLIDDRLREQEPAGPVRQAIRKRMAERARADAQEAVEASRAAGALGPVEGFMAAGKGKQRLYVLPDQRMTVVRFGALDGSRSYEDADFLAILLGTQR
jgi:CubicO group peptidase (beta-lactamase class C family)